MKHIVKILSEEPKVFEMPSDLLDCDTWILRTKKGLRKKCKRGDQIIYEKK
jgi:hypothetical protein